MLLCPYVSGLAATGTASRLYAEDTDAESPNASPRECWPSTQEFRNALFRAGKSYGRKASSYLDRIKDPDLRLFAEIDFIAALAGLPLFAGSRRFHPQTRSYWHFQGGRKTISRTLNRRDLLECRFWITTIQFPDYMSL